MAAQVLQAAENFVWVEGEAPAKSNAVPHSWYTGQVKKNELSGGDFLGHWSDRGPGEAEYSFKAGEGEYDFWIRANPVQSSLSWSLNGGEQTAVDFSRGQTGNVNIASDNKPDLRFVAWSYLGKVRLKEGKNSVAFRMDSANNNHGIIDCFVFTKEPFAPIGVAKPDEIARRMEQVAADNAGWSVWNPARDSYEASPIDLRFLNEKVAGENGFVRVEGGRFVLGSGKPVRFWAVNGPPAGLKGEDLRRCARDLAKRGVNLVRVHGSVFDERNGEFNPAMAGRFQEIAAAMKAEGIYTHLSIYFPLWMKPQPGLSWLQGYDGQKHPFGAIYFNREFQEVYRGWWKQILTTPGAEGKTLVEDPSIFGVEIVNEDSLLFWTFAYDRVPEQQMEILEKLFGTWLEKKHGSLDRAYAAWNNLRLDRDRPAEGRMAFRNLYDISTYRTPRDQDTAQFLTETQKAFYDESKNYIRGLGFQGLITASNWITANDAILGPLERYSYTGGDFIDRHGYFGGILQGHEAGWSIRDGHVFSHRSALRFESEEPGKGRAFTHPVFDSKINGLPSMISETTFTRPNRYRTEGPLFYAVYGALQGSDSIVHFAWDGLGWPVKPKFFMQPWTLSTPAMMGQFPAAALIYREGLVREGEMMAELGLPLADLYALKGNPLAVRANLDELRKEDIPLGGGLFRTRIDPLIFLVGKTRIDLGAPAPVWKAEKLESFIDAKAQTVKSSTGEILLDYGKGWMKVDAEKVQAVLGNLKEAGPVELQAMKVASGMDLLAVVLVPLDGQALQSSRKMLLQVMSEEKASNFQAEAIGEGKFRIGSIGTDPWLVKNIEAEIRLKRPDAATLKATALDPNGYPAGEAGNGEGIQLKPGVFYYLLEKP